MAAEVFGDPLSLTIEDRVVDSEQRSWTIGRLENLSVLLVVHTLRDEPDDEVVRIISARTATPRERGSMKKKPSQRQRDLQRIARIPDTAIDTSDIPEMTEEQLRRAVRGRMYRPIKKPVTIRLDVDTIEWLKEEGPGYQTKANRLLRAEMLRERGPRRSSSSR